MVNIGGPSKGCTTCIRRKIKCDRQQPVCGQCQKAYRPCGGYRDANDIMFRDQSQDTIARAQASSSKQISIRRKSEPTQQTSSSNIGKAGQTLRSSSIIPALPRAPTPDLEIGSIEFFTTNFTSSGPAEFPTNLFWVPTNFDDLLKNECFKLSVQSVGSMAMARLQRSTDLHREAQKKYSQALISLAQQFREHPSEVDNDYALFTVFFLGFFEILATYNSAFSRRSWMTHLGGLGILLQRRGDEFVSTSFGARMLLQSRAQAITAAFQSKQPLVEVFREPAQRTYHLLPPQLRPAADADLLFIRLTDLQAQTNSSTSPRALLFQLYILDDDFCQWGRSVPLSYASPVQGVPYDLGMWWDVRHDVYPIPIALQVWNRVRAARIILRDLIQELSLRTSTGSIDDAAPDALDKDLRRLATDICSSVYPCYRPSTAVLATGETIVHPPLGTIYWLLWPLETVGAMRNAPLDLVRWVQQCLERIHETHGIVRAQVAADRLKKRYEDSLPVDREADERGVYELL